VLHPEPVTEYSDLEDLPNDLLELSRPSMSRSFPA
jgi:hypothetical protein